LQGKTLKSTGFTPGDLSKCGVPAKSEILWGINHVKHHMDEREIVADYLNAGQ
jgi:hypothetical protein